MIAVRVLLADEKGKVDLRRSLLRDDAVLAEEGVERPLHGNHHERRTDDLHRDGADQKPPLAAQADETHRAHHHERERRVHETELPEEAAEHPVRLALLLRRKHAARAAVLPPRQHAPGDTAEHHRQRQ